MFLKPSIPTRYILFELIPTFFVGVIVFVSILLMFQVLRLTEFVLVHGVDLRTVLKMIGFMSLSFLPAILPMSLLFAVIMTYGRLSQDSEIVAFKAAGLHLGKLAVPSLMLGVAMAVVSLETTFNLAPWGNRSFELLIREIGSSKVVDTIREGTFSEGFFDLVVYANKVDSKTNQLEQVFLYDGRDESLPMTIIAQRGQILRDPENPKYSTLLRLESGSIHRSQEESYTKVNFKTYDIHLTQMATHTTSEKTPPSLTFSELEELLADPKTTPQSRWILETEFQKRLAVSFACLIFSILGVGLGVVTDRRSGKSSGMVMAIGIIIVYWGLYVAGESLARQGSVSPLISMWISNALFLIIGAIAFKKHWN